MRSPWWQGLDLRVLRHVRGVLRRRGLELTLVERRPTEPAAFAPLSADDLAGPGLAVIAPDLSAPEVGLIEQIVAPLRRPGNAGAQGRAEEIGSEIAALAVRLHATLVKSGLRAR